MRRWRAAAALVLTAMLAPLFSAPPAAAAPTELADIGWWPTRDGVIHCTTDANHYVCDWLHPLWWEPAAIDFWMPPWCVFAGVTAGDWVWEPARIRFAPPAGSGLACISLSDGAVTWWNQFYAWSDGTWAAGQAWYSPRVRVSPWRVPFRGDSERGTIVEIY